MSLLIKLLAPAVAFLAAVVAFVSDCMNWYPVMQQVVAWIAGKSAVIPVVAAPMM